MVRSDIACRAVTANVPATARAQLAVLSDLVIGRDLRVKVHNPPPPLAPPSTKENGRLPHQSLLASHARLLRRRILCRAF